jgi:hypothetical protein
MLLASSAVSATDAPEVLEIRRGETVSAEMAAGDPDTTFVVFELTSETDEPLTVATDTLHFDTLLEVEETATGRLVGWDDDGGAGTNSRLTLRAESGKIYRVKVGAGLDDWGGPFRLSIAQGEAPAPDWKNDGQASLDYWRAVEAEGNSGGPPVLAARAALGLAAWDRSSQRYEEARSGIEQAHRLFEDLLGAGHLSTAGCTVTLAFLHQDLGDHVGARGLLEEAQEAYSRVLGPRHWLTLNLGLSLATTAGKTEESTQAIALYRSLLGQLEDRLGPKHPLYLEKLSDLSARRESALGLAVSIAVETAPENPGAATEVWDAVIASRAIVLDEVASRHGRIVAVARLAQQSAQAASRLADLTVRGPGDSSSVEYENRLRAARLERERADQALALATAGLEDRRCSATRGVRGVSAVLPTRGALVAYLLYDREIPRPPGDRDDSSTGGSGDRA